MPKIQEYLPEVEAPGPTQGLDTNLAQVQDLGKGVQAFGADVGEMLQKNKDRQEQTEAADAYSNIAAKRTDMVQQISDQEADGTLDADKIGKQVDDWAATQQDNYSTRQSQDYFQRQTARLKGSLVKAAVAGQVRVGYANGKADYEADLSNDTATVSANPSMHDDVVTDNLNNIDQMVQDKRINPAQAPMIKVANQQQIAMAAIKSTALTDPDKAAALLDATNDQNLRTALSPAQQGEMDQYVALAKKSQLYDGEAQLKAQKAQQQIKEDSFVQQNFARFTGGTMPAKEITAAVMNGTMSPEHGTMWIEKNRLMQGQVESNPAAVNKLRDKIFLPDSSPNQIKDQYQLMAQIGKGVSAQDVQAMIPYLDKSPQGRALNTNRKMVLDMAKAQLVTKTSPMGESDPEGEYTLLKFTNAMANQESELAAQGQPIASLYDPNSKNFIGNSIKNYAMTSMEKFQAKAARDAGHPPPTNIYAPPGATPAPITIPSPTPEPMVDMINPNGVAGKVRKSKAPEALTKGYKYK